MSTTRNPFDHPKARFDLTRFPPQFLSVAPELFLLVVRAVFDLASSLARGDHDLAVETTYQVLYHATTDKLWDPNKAPLRGYMLALVPDALRELRFGSNDERRACAAFAQENSRYLTRTPEDILIEAEEQVELEALEHESAALAAAVEAKIAAHPLAPKVVAIWREHGDVRPRVIAEMLGVPRSDVYGAIELLRYNANQCLKAVRRRRQRGDQS